MVIALPLGGALTSCQDFFEVGSDHVIYAEKDHLNNATDTIYSMIGILNKLQALGDRTVLLGEVRGDLVDVNSVTSSDLRDVATFNIGDDNKYNCPRDYYAVINNCNYFIANADTALKNSRNEYIFMKEYAAAKAIRAWTYLQLVTTYGKVPFVTKPILSKEESEAAYPMYDIKQVCDYFINEDGLDKLVDVEAPGYATIKSVPSGLFYIPMRLILGDLNLWAGNYKQAALCYYNYIDKRNGTNGIYPTGTSKAYWSSHNWGYAFSDLSYSREDNGSQSEIITMIPGDSIPSEGYYSELRKIFNTDAKEGDYEFSLVPSQGLIELSEAQKYCYYNMETQDTLYAPTGLKNHMSGDLRLIANWNTYENAVNNNGERYTSQYINKYATRNIHIYRRMLVYLRLAEALNCAGYPRFAYQILATGVNNTTIKNNIEPYYHADSLWLAQFNFNPTQYYVDSPFAVSSTENTIGIHSRGCGDTQLNKYYQMPYNEEITDSLEQIAWQQKMVEDMIVDEQALELSFEGYRFYDLMRVALRKNDPSYLADRIKARRGKGNDAGISVDLTDKKNWYLKWNNQIGL